MTFGPNQNNYNTNQGKGMFMGSSQCQLTQLLRLHCKALWTFSWKVALKCSCYRRQNFEAKSFWLVLTIVGVFYEFFQCECLLMHKRKKWEKNSNDDQRGRKLFWIIYFMYKFWRLVFLIKPRYFGCYRSCWRRTIWPFFLPSTTRYFQPVITSGLEKVDFSFSGPRALRYEIWLTIPS